MRASVKTEAEVKQVIAENRKGVRTTFTYIPPALQNEFNKCAVKLGLTKRELYLICIMMVIKKLGGEIPDFRGKRVITKKWKNR